MSSTSVHAPAPEPETGAPTTAAGSMAMFVATSRRELATWLLTTMYPNTTGRAAVLLLAVRDVLEMTMAMEDGIPWAPDVSPALYVDLWSFLVKLIGDIQTFADHQPTMLLDLETQAKKLCRAAVVHPWLVGNPHAPKAIKQATFMARVLVMMKTAFPASTTTHAWFD